MMEFDFSGIVPAIPGLWNGMLMTLKLMALGVVGGIILGTLLALMRLSHNKLLSNLAGAYVNYFRSIPLLLEKGSATSIGLIASGVSTDVYITLGLGDTVG